MKRKKGKMNKEQELKEDILNDDTKVEIETTDENKDEETNIEDIKSENESEEENGEELLKKEIQELNDKLLRRAAEFENYKRRTEGEIQSILKFAAEPFIKGILPVYDDLGRSLSHADEGNTESFIKGLKMVFEKFSKALDEQGVKKMDTKGKEFDFNYHEALLQQPTNDAEPNTIIEEVEAGYLYKEKVIKHAKVIVSKEME